MNINYCCLFCASIYLVQGIGEPLVAIDLVSPIPKKDILKQKDQNNAMEWFTIPYSFSDHIHARRVKQIHLLDQNQTKVLTAPFDPDATAHELRIDLPPGKYLLYAESVNEGEFWSAYGTQVHVKSQETASLNLVPFDLHRVIRNGNPNQKKFDSGTEVNRLSWDPCEECQSYQVTLLRLITDGDHETLFDSKVSRETFVDFELGDRSGVFEWFVDGIDEGGKVIARFGSGYFIVNPPARDN
jgi:hypothetical protein